MHDASANARAFDFAEAAVMRHAYEKAWDRVRWTHATNAVADDGIKSQLASLIIEIASRSALDADTIANQAVERLAQ